MKVKIISRSADDYLRGTKKENHKVFHNYDPSLHPFEAAREYTRALNAVKLEKVFAKPFLGSLDGHRDSVSCIAKHPRHLATIASGSFDGELRVWDIPQRLCLREFVAHNGIVRGIVYTPKGDHFITIGDDKTVKTWNSLTPQFGEEEEPLNTVLSKTVITSITHHKKSAMFATAGEVLQVWEETRNEPLKSYQWGVDSLHDIAFNMVEPNVLGACASDRSIILYDTRDNGPLRKVIMKLRPNKLAWNPMEAFIFTVANEDYNLYTFDCRNLKKPANVHMDHVEAVTFVDYAPTGKEFVSGSYDKTIRIFPTDHGHSREIYHTKRMQRLTCVHWTLDNKFIISGSDEMNIRIWKARASEKLGPLTTKERNALDCAEALKEKFASYPQIKRISRHRQVPKHIYNAQRELRTIKEKQKKKESNRRRHSKKGKVPYVAERDKHVIKEVN
ncbi:DDB1- and CUL4-associated factor 13 [Euwallacea similis]|uniref:DDB1- and CUL4-associated factor 13 n=1 Tax=Euwallacea similis TaxID=1736056 RepID=UPI00344BFC8B